MIYLFEDISKGSSCDPLDEENNVVDAEDADRCCQGEEYCCADGKETAKCGDGSDSCGHRFRCSGGGCLADDCCACDASIGQTSCDWEEPATCRDGYVAIK